MLTVYWLLFFTPLLIWTCFAFKRKKQFQIILSMVILAVFLFLSISIHFYPGADYLDDLELTKQVTGRSFLLGKPMLRYINNSKGSSGDFFSISVYRLSNKEVKYFQEATTTFSVYPQKTIYHKQLSVSKWRPTPMTNEDDEQCSFIILSNPGRDNNQALKQAQELLKSLLIKPGNYYAFLFKLDPSHETIETLNFFLVSPGQRVIIFVSSYS